jgi:hypothetical protein
VSFAHVRSSWFPGLFWLQHSTGLVVAMERKFVLINSQDVVTHFSHENAISEIEEMFRTSDKYINPGLLVLASHPCAYF